MASYCLEWKNVCGDRRRVRQGSERESLRYHLLQMHVNDTIQIWYVPAWFNTTSWLKLFDSYAKRAFPSMRFSAEVKGTKVAKLNLEGKIESTDDPKS